MTRKRAWLADAAATEMGYILELDLAVTIRRFGRFAKRVAIQRLGYLARPV